MESLIGDACTCVHSHTLPYLVPVVKGCTGGGDRCTCLCVLRVSQGMCVGVYCMHVLLPEAETQVQCA
jgi:hypothetical protein